MDPIRAGARNLAAFVAATAGRLGEVGTLPGGLAVCAPVAVMHGYVDAAVRTDPDVDATEFLDAATAFYAERQRPFVLWVAGSQPDLAEIAVARGAIATSGTTPAMWADGPFNVPVDLDVAPLADADDRATFGRLAEEGYALPGMAWLFEQHGCYDAPRVTWMIARHDGEPVGVACGLLAGDTGGLYTVATPERFRGRGAATAVTVAVTNELFRSGAGVVTLQATDAGFRVYRRLGYRTYDTFRRYEVHPG